MYQFPLPFPVGEYRERVEKVKASMILKNIEVLLITDPGNIFYLTGYGAKSYYVEQVLIVHQNSDMPIFIGRYIDAFSGVLKTTWLDRDHVLTYPDEYIQSQTKHPMDWISHKLIDMGFGKKNIGIEVQHDYLSPYAWERYKENLKEANLLDGSFIVNWVRIIKSDLEIEFMRRAGKITERMVQTFYEKAEPGVRLCDVAAAVEYAGISGTEEFGGEYSSGPIMFPRGVLGGAPHTHWDDQLLPNSLTMFMECAGVYRRYHAPVSRTMSLGKPSDVFLHTANVSIEGLEAVLASAKAGMTCSEVYEVFRKVMAKHGLEKESRLAYSVGASFPPTWGEKTISVRASDHTVLEPNMCLHCIPAMYYDDYGTSISQTIRITEDGVEKLYDIPFEVVVKS